MVEPVLCAGPAPLQQECCSAWDLVAGGHADHQLLGVHHVNDLVPIDQRILWGIGFLVWGAAMFIGG